MASIRHIGSFPNLMLNGKKFCPVEKTDADGIVPNYGPGTLYPIAMRLISIMALYWRIRKWRFTHTLDGNEEPITAVAEYITAPQSELELLCGFEGGTNTRTIEYAMITEYDFGFEVGQSFSSMSLFGYGQKGPIILQVENESGQSELYPRMQIAWEGPIRLEEIDDELVTLALGSSSIKTQTTAQFGEQVIRILSHEYKVPMYSQRQESYYCGEIAPAEFWPYDPNDGGGPIYDRATGQQLRPFPN